ncbi:MAG: hypothetical protein NTX88_03135, partial [Candidatus Atribacteria bacterium]|nr:hypothetical protein [Candidatus Atribacteria bacterium]
MKKRTTLSLLLLICLLGVLGLISGGWAANPPDYDKIYKATLKKWTRTADIGDAFSVRAVLWNPELVQAWVAKYGKENLLSADEETAYHLDFIQREKMSHYLVFEVTITRHGGAPLYPMNFSNNTFLTGDKGHKFSLIDYPKEFDEKI